MQLRLFSCHLRQHHARHQCQSRAHLIFRHIVLQGIKLDRLGHQTFVLDRELHLAAGEPEERRLRAIDVKREELFGKAAYQTGKIDAAEILAAERDVTDHQIAVRLVPAGRKAIREGERFETQFAGLDENLLLRVGGDRKRELVLPDLDIGWDAVEGLGQPHLEILE
ncbi:hypothetical protein D3C86_1256240 [compost metagenome]